MINWNILGIEPTEDRSVIKKAYRARLQDTNPEDKPEEFMALREAYEQALEYARNGGKSPYDEDEDGENNGRRERSVDDDLLPPDHPAYDWTKKLIALYKDFFRRIRPENWEELAADPLCTRIDTSRDVEGALLRFLMDWWYVPDGVIWALNKVFHFDENKDRLMEQYPHEFVDAILLTPLGRTSGGFDYDMFEGEAGMAYDSYISMYYNLTGLVGRGEHEEALKCIQAMEDTGIFHPYINVEKTKICLSSDQVDEAEETISQVWPKYGASAAVCCMAGEVKLVKEDFEAACDRFHQALEDYPDSRWAKIGLAEANLGLGNLDEAEDWINQVLAEDRYSPRGKDLEAKISAAQKEVLMEKASKASEDEEGASPEDLLKLGIIHVDNNEYEEAVQVLSSFHADNKRDEAERVHFLATAQLDLDDLDNALTNFTEAETLLRSLLEVTAHEDEQRHTAANLCRSMVMKSLVLENLGRLEDALEVVTNATIDFPDMNMPFCRKAELHYELHQYQEAVDAATASINLDDTFHLPYRIRANAYADMGYFNEAYDDCNACIDLYTGDIDAFFCKINILTQVGETDGALSELDSLESQVSGTRITFLRAQAYKAAGDLPKAKDNYLKVLEMDADEEREVFYPAELSSLEGVYYQLYQVYNALYEEKRNGDDWRNAMYYLTSGNKRYPDNLALMAELAGEYYAQSRHTEAQKLYEKMIEIEPSGRHYSQLAGNEIQLDRFDDAYGHLQTALELDANLTYAQILLGALYTHREDYPTALEHYQKAHEMAERNEEVWYRIYHEMAHIYGRMKQPEKAIEYLNKNYELYHQEEDYSTMLEFLRLEGKWDQAIRLGDEYLASHEVSDSLQVLEELKLAAMMAKDDDAFEKYQAMDTRGFTAGYQKGRLYLYRQGRYQTALDSFLEASDYSRNSINNNIEIAKLYLKMKNKKKAAEYARKVLDAIPDDFELCGYNRAYYLTRSAEALAILGDFAEAKKRLDKALSSRKCDFCKFCGCIDAYCALAYIACIQGKEDDVNKYIAKGLEVSPYDYDLLNLPQHFMKKRGLFR